MNFIFKYLIFCLPFLFIHNAFSQINIFELMERTDLPIKEVEKIADAHFAIVGTGQGSGNKQYQRWLYERKFHLNEDGYYIKPEIEDKAYYDIVGKRTQYRSGLVWTELGPDRWNRTSSWNPGVGRITSVAVHSQDTTVIYVSSPGGGIWKSVNSGVSWTPLIDFVNSAWMNIFHLAIDPNNNNTIYASITNGGVLKSINGGVSWAITGSGISDANQVKVHPDSSNIVFCAASNGIFRSINGGATWLKVHSITKEDIEFNPIDPDIMYASGNASSNPIYRSVDNGKTWVASTNGGGQRTLIAVTAANPALVYAVQAAGSIFGSMKVSIDTGKSFTNTIIGSASAGTNFFGYDADGEDTRGQATYDMAICVNPLNADEVHIAGISNWKSIDGGKSFFPETNWYFPNNYGYNHADVHALEWVNGTIYSGSDGGIYKSVDLGGNWIDLTNGIGIKQIYRISCSQTDREVIVLGAQDNGSSFRQSNGNWVDWLGADGMDNVISPTDAKIAIGTSQYGSIYKTTNSGSGKFDLTKPNDGNWITPLAIHPTNHNIVFGGWQGVYKSTNGGASWSKISTSLSSKINILEVAKSNPDYLYATVGSNIYVTKNGGTSWTTYIAPTTVNSLFISQTNPEKIWIACNSSGSSKIYVSESAGSSFTNISTGLPNIVPRSIVVDEEAAETIYVGMNIGVFYRDSITKIWTEHATGLPLVAINEVEIQKSGGKLRVATYGRGIWESNLQNVNYACDEPKGLSTNSISSVSAFLSWDAVIGAKRYQIQYKLNGSNSWLVYGNNIVDTFINLTGLMGLSAYDWRVLSDCEVSKSNFVASSFTTTNHGVGIDLKDDHACTGFVALYPNPTDNQLTLDFNLKGEELKTEIKIFDLNSRVVYGSKVNGVKGLNHQYLDISTLSKGTYQLQLNIGNYSEIKSFVISR